ncbi:unnamed protein product [Closterium sp. NIES-53]
MAYHPDQPLALPFLALPVAPLWWLRAALPCPLRRLACHTPTCPTSRAALPNPCAALLAAVSPCPACVPCWLRATLSCLRAALLAATLPCPARAPPCWPPRRPALRAHRLACLRVALPCLRAALLAAAPPCPARAPPCPCVALPCPARTPPCPSRVPPRPALRASLALARCLARRAIFACFDTWIDELQLYLLSDSRDGVLLFDLTSGASLAPPATADSATRSQWLTCDAAARLAIRNHLPLAERAHFGQHKTAKALYVDVVARYSSPATAALSRLILPYLFPELSAFATVEDLITHLRTSDTRYRAALKAGFLDKNPPPMYIIPQRWDANCSERGQSVRHLGR